MVLEVEPVRIGRVPGDLVDALAELRIRIGRKTAETPLFDGAQLAPPSLVRKTPAVDTATVTASRSRGSVSTVCSPSPPPPGTQRDRVGCSQSGRTSSNDSPRSSDRNSAAGSVPA